MASKQVHTGEKPGSGVFVCTNCGTDIKLDSHDKMPPCPKCSNTCFTKSK